MRRSINKTKTSNDGWFWTNLRIYTPFRALAVVAASAMLVVGCGREGGMARSLDQVDYTSGEAKNAKPSESARLSSAADQLRAKLDAGGRTLGEEEIQGLAPAVARISDDVAKLERRLVGERSKVGKVGSAAALGRLEKVIASVAESRKEFDTAFARLRHASPARPADSTPLRAALARLVAPAAEQPLSSAPAFRSAEPQRESAPLSAGSTPAYAAPTSGAPASALPRSAEAADLAETPETTLTPSLQALADSLDRDPVKISNYVRSHIKFEPYYGVRKGAAGTLAEQSGSAADQAALLVALLRASGTHARFVQGTAEFTVEQLRSWLGVDSQLAVTPAKLADIMASGGIPTTQLRVNGAVTKVRVAHVWAEGYVAASAYRGVEESIGGKRWLPLDPSVKANVTTNEELGSTVTQAELVDVAETFREGVQTTDGGNAHLLNAAPTESKIGALLPGATTSVEGVNSALDLDGTKIESKDLPVLPESLPFRTVAVHAELRSLPASLIARVTINVGGSTPGARIPTVGEDTETTVATVPTMDLVGKRFTIGYAPATSDDAEIVDAYHGLFATPAAAAQVVPVLRLDGKVLSAGSAGIGLGYTQRLRLTYYSPGFAADVIDNPLEAGGLTALAIDVGTKSISGFKDRAAKLDELRESTTEQNTLTDARLGEFLSMAGDVYFLKNDLFNAGLAARGQVHAQRAVSGALVQLALEVTVIGGFPLSVDAGALAMDVDQDIQAINPLGTNVDTAAYLRASATHASGSEGSALAIVFRQPGAGLSTTAVLAEAAARDIPIYTLNAENFEQVRSNIVASGNVMNQIAAAVADGATVTVPGRALTLDGWTGTAYIVDSGGALDYRIAGGRSGGYLPIPGVAGVVFSIVLILSLVMGMITEGVENWAACIAALLVSWVVLMLDFMLIAIFGLAAPFVVLLFLFFGLLVIRQLHVFAGLQAANECLGNTP